MSLIKYILFIFNVLFAVKNDKLFCNLMYKVKVLVIDFCLLKISGLAIIIAGGVVLGDLGRFAHFMDGKIIGPPIVLIVAGAIVFVIAFLGCYGAIKENYTLLMAVSSLLSFPTFFIARLRVDPS